MTMNAKQILAVLDRASIDGNLAADCRSLMTEESKTIRARIAKMDETQALVDQAERRDREFPRAQKDDVARAARARLEDDAAQARARVATAVVEAERVARMWRVIA
jgi:ABC-type Na+ transport system ATPase subunit NatA